MWYLIEAFLSALVIVTFVTQVLLPVLLQRPMFPIWRWGRVQRDFASTLESLELRAAHKSVEEMQHPAAQEGEKKDGTS